MFTKPTLEDRKEVCRNRAIKHAASNGIIVTSSTSWTLLHMAMAVDLGWTDAANEFMSEYIRAKLQEIVICDTR